MRQQSVMYIFAHGNWAAIVAQSFASHSSRISLRPSLRIHSNLRTGCVMTERRSSPRTKLQRLAYIHIEPDNGGIVLDASSDGLGFHSMSAIERNGPMHFSLQEQNRRIDVCGELIWTDEMQKSGGLKFTTLTSEARSQIGEWVSRPEITEEQHSTVGAAFLRAFPGLGMRRQPLPGSFAGSFSAARTVLKARVQVRLSSFSGGVLAGIIASSLVFCLAYLGYGYRHQFGESLIRWGERLAQRSEGSKAGLGNGPGVQGIASGAQAASTITRRVETPAAADRIPDSKVPHEAKTNARATARPAVGATITKLNPPPRAPAAGRVTSPVHRDDLVARKSTIATAPTANPTTPADVKPSVALAENRVLTPNAQSPAMTAQALPQPSDSSPRGPLVKAPDASVPNIFTHSPSRTAVDIIPAPSFADFVPPQMFFDLGKFKQQALAQDFRDQVAQLGFPTSVVQRGHLWMNSFQVLVGPYISEVEEKKINSELLSRGYKPRPFERGSHDISFRSRVSIERTRLPVGDFHIGWESYVTDAKVKFTMGGDEIVSTSGRWMKRGRKYANNEYVYLNQPDGSRPLVEIHFAGLDRALVFRSLP